MNINEALTILNLSGDITPSDTKLAYRRACAQFHPDRNPAGLEMMKIINAAYDVLRDYTGSSEQTAENHFADELSDAINAVVNLDGVIVEVCGTWIWLSGETYQHRAIIKDAGYKFASKKKMWYFGEHSAGRGAAPIEQIRTTYGSKTIVSTQRSIGA